MAIKKPRDGTPGMTDQSPRWEGPPATKPSGYLPAKDNPERDRDAHGENLNDPKVRKVSDAFKTKKNR